MTEKKLTRLQYFGIGCLCVLSVCLFVYMEPVKPIFDLPEECEWHFVYGGEDVSGDVFVVVYGGPEINCYEPSELDVVYAGPGDLIGADPIWPHAFYVVRIEYEPPGGAPFVTYHSLNGDGGLDRVGLVLKPPVASPEDFDVSVDADGVSLTASNGKVFASHAVPKGHGRGGVPLALSDSDYDAYVDAKFEFEYEAPYIGTYCDGDRFWQGFGTLDARFGGVHDYADGQRANVILCHFAAHIRFSFDTANLSSFNFTYGAVAGGWQRGNGTG